MPVLRESHEESMPVRNRPSGGVEILSRVPAADPKDLRSRSYGSTYPETSLNKRPTGLPDAGQKCRSEIRFRAVLTPVK